MQHPRLSEDCGRECDAADTSGRIRTRSAFVVAILMATSLQATEVDPAASSRCEGWLREREAIVAEVGRPSREGPLFFELGRQIHEQCLGPAIAPRVRGVALLADARASGPDRPAAEQRALLEEARRLLQKEAPKSRESILVLEQLASLTGEFSLSECESFLEESLRLRGEVFGAESRKAIAGRHKLVAFLRFRGRTELEVRADLPTARSEAERFVQESVALFGEGDPVTVLAWADLAEILGESGRQDAAESLREKHVYPYPGAFTTGSRLAELIE